MMKPVDGLLVLISLGALALAGAVVYRSHQQEDLRTPEPVASASAPPPPADAFPSCKNLSPEMKRLRCEVAIARKNDRIRCIDGRLYHLGTDATGHEHLDPWPANLRCSTQ